MIVVKINAQNLTDFQVFEIDPKLDTVLFTALGSQISIKKLSFKDEEDNLIKDAKVTLKLKEVVDQKDMILEGITTTTTDKILISNGMILIDGFVNEKKIEIRKETPFKVKIPTTNGLTNMSIFTIPDSTRTWQKSNIKVELEPCSSYKEQVITRNKQVTKSEYKRWSKKSVRTESTSNNRNIDKDLLPELVVGGETFDRLFGGAIRQKKPYAIPVTVDTIWHCADNDIAYYSFDIQSFGWYNIDKFKTIKYPVNLIVTTDEDLDIYLIFHTENVCLNAKKAGKNKYKFMDIPGKKNATIIAYRINDYNSINFLSKRIYTFKQNVELQPSKEMPVGEFNRIMKLLKL